MYQLETLVTPNEAKDYPVTWSSNDTSKITIDLATGIIKGVSPRIAVITVTAHNGKVGTCAVVVKDLFVDR